MSDTQRSNDNQNSTNKFVTDQTDETKNHPLIVTKHRNSKQHAETSWYHRALGSALKVAVKPKLIGNLPEDILYANNSSESDPIVFYVMQENSRSNSHLIENQTRAFNLPPALAPVNTENFSEKTAIIYIDKQQSGSLFSKKYAHSPRLFRILQTLTKTDAEILLVPVSINWGRDPGKEDSLLKILAADSWANTTVTKQLLNIGIHGQDNTYIQFHPTVNLRCLVKETSTCESLETATSLVESHLITYLNQQREIMLGPDLSDRRTEIDKILFSPAIKHAITKESHFTNEQPKDVRELARGYMHEIVADFSPATVKMCERILNWLWTQLYDGVNVHHFDGIEQPCETDGQKSPDSSDSLRALAEKYELIFLPCHRSHLDYLLILYVLHRNGLRTPYVASGDNLNMPVLGNVMRGGGAFFLRRSFNGNYLYTSVFKEYVHSIIARNISLKFFLEGGRSRSGRLLQPKTGMVAMSVQSRLREKVGKPIAYIPTYIGYERLAEGNSYLGEIQGKPKESESLFQIMRAMRKIERIFGMAHMNFGEPIFLDDVLEKHNINADDYDADRNDQPLADDAKDAVNDLAITTLQNINKAAVINPVSLLSLVLLSTNKHAITEKSCIEQLDLYKDIATKAPYDERTILTKLSGKEIIDYGLKLKLIKRVKHVMGDMISVAEEDQSILLSYFTNNILHLFIMPSLIAALVHHNGRIQKDDLYGMIQSLYPYIKSEYFLKWKKAEIESLINHITSVMVNAGLLMDDSKGNLYAETPNTLPNLQLKVLASPVQQTLKRYFMALALISQQGSGKISTEQAVDLCALVGQRLAVLYEHQSPDFFDKSVFSGFIATLKRKNYLTEDENNNLLFNQKIDIMAENARFVLDAQTLDTLKQMATLTDEEINTAIADFEKKKQKRFNRKNKKS